MADQLRSCQLYPVRLKASHINLKNGKFSHTPIDISFLPFLITEKCNETVLVGDLVDLNSATLTLKLEKVRKADRGKELYCWFRFEGAPGQFVQVDVKGIRAGTYDGSAHE